MTSFKPFRSLGATVLLVLIVQPTAAQSLDWVHQLTGVIGPTDDIAIGFTGRGSGGAAAADNLTAIALVPCHDKCKSK